MHKTLTIFLISLLLSFNSCTSGGSGSTGINANAGAAGNIGENGTEGGLDGSAAGTSGGTTTGGTTTGGVTTGGTTTGGTTAGGTGGGVSGIISSSISVTAASNGFGFQEIDIPVLDGNILSLNLSLTTLNAFQVILQDGSNLIATSSLSDPNGNTVIPNAQGELTTLAIAAGAGINTLNYQTRAEDPAVIPGVYNQLVVFGEQTSGNIRATVLAKNDTNFSSGSLDLNLFLVGQEVQNNRDDITNAFEQARTIFSQNGISINLSTFDVQSSNGVIPNPISGSSFYGNQGFVSSTSSQMALNVYVGDFISNDSSTNINSSLDSILGVASSIPGPAILTDFSAIAISFSEHQGVDGVLSTTERAVLAETIAHESGHFLGLFHPVEIDFSQFDPLDDTAQCSSITECLNSGLTNNLMFPTPLPGVSQRTLSNNQREVLHRNILVD